KAQGRIQLAVNGTGLLLAVGNHIEQLLPVDKNLPFNTFNIGVNHAAGATVFNFIEMAVEGFADIQLNPHQPCLGNCIVGNQSIGGIGQNYGDSFARNETQSNLRIGQSVGGEIKIAKAEGSVPFCKAGGIAILKCSSTNQRADLHYFLLIKIR